MRVPFTLALVTLLACFHSRAGRPSSPEQDLAELRERGQYLVEQVALCVQCHTPRGPDLELLREGWLEGAVVPVRSPYPDRPWAFRAPPIAGLRGYGDADVIALLTRGTARTGKPPLPPMPAYRMRIADAQAIIAYLRSLS